MWKDVSASSRLSTHQTGLERGNFHQRTESWSTRDAIYVRICATKWHLNTDYHSVWTSLFHGEPNLNLQTFKKFFKLESDLYSYNLNRATLWPPPIKPIKFTQSWGHSVSRTAQPPPSNASLAERNENCFSPLHSYLTPWSSFATKLPPVSTVFKPRQSFKA